MRSPLIRRAGKNSSRNKDARSKERGVTLALIAAAMVAIIGMAALSIDIGTLYQAKAEAQRAADAAALTAARVISLSGVTGDPDTAASWLAVCGPSGTATVAASAIAKAQWNFIGGVAAPNVTVTYGTGAGVADCSTLAGSTSTFTVNPTVSVYVQQPNVPTFFGRIFALIPGGTSKNSGVSATATAEVYNPSGSASVGSGVMVPVWPRCVKPWIVPDRDPLHPANCNTVTNPSPCSKLVEPLGTISSPGIVLGGAAGPGVIGESFNLLPDCNTTSACNSGPPFSTIAQPNVTTTPPSTPNLQYLPAYVQNPSPAASSCADSNDDQQGEYQQAIAGCDNITPYQCGVPFGGPAPSTQVNLNENPYGGTGDTSVAAQCLIHASATGPANSGQDTLVTASFPFVIQAGSSNPLGVASSTNISTSTSVVTVPIYESSGALPAGLQPPVTIIGFLQVFINYVNADGSLNVTVLNVSGCSNSWISGGAFVTGSSPVPVRLITPPSP